MLASVIVLTHLITFYDRNPALCEAIQACCNKKGIMSSVRESYAVMQIILFASWRGAVPPPNFPPSPPSVYASCSHQFCGFLFFIMFNIMLCFSSRLIHFEFVIMFTRFHPFPSVFIIFLSFVLSLSFVSIHNFHDFSACTSFSSFFISCHPFLFDHLSSVSLFFIILTQLLLQNPALV